MQWKCIGYVYAAYVFEIQIHNGDYILKVKDNYLENSFIGTSVKYERRIHTIFRTDSSFCGQEMNRFVLFSGAREEDLEYWLPMFYYCLYKFWRMQEKTTIRLFALYGGGMFYRYEIRSSWLCFSF